MEIDKIASLVRVMQRALKAAKRLVAEAEALGIEVVKRRRRKKGTGEMGKAIKAKLKKSRKPGPAMAREEGE